MCSKSKRPDELHHLKRVFKKNGYPRQVVDRAIHKNRRSSSNNDKRDEDCKLLYLPYVKSISEKIQRGIRHLIRHLKVRTVFKSQHTLWLESSSLDQRKKGME